MRAEFRIDHVALEARDLAASAAFYGDLLRLEEIENRTRRPINAHFCLLTPHFDATLDYLQSRGVRYRNIRGEEMTFNLRGDGVRQTYFQDPDNYWIEVCEAHPDGAAG